MDTNMPTLNSPQEIHRLLRAGTLELLKTMLDW